jgi:hypothetical protein
MDSDNQQPETVDKTRSKYELTLAEFPTFPVSKNQSEAFKIRVFEDTIAGKDGEVIKRNWTLVPHGEFGFGTPSTHSTLFELLQIWKEAGFSSQYIRFGSVFNLLKRMGKKAIGNSQYKQIVKDLEILVGITVKAKNAFWDNELKAYVDTTFHIFESVHHYKEGPRGQARLFFAYIKASDYLFNNSILKNSLLSLPFGSKFFHSLTPVEQRLALYLSKVFRSQAINKRELIEFSSQIPLEVKEPKLIKQRIKLACNGLMGKGFPLLAGFDFEKSSHDKSTIVIFRRNGQPQKPKQVSHEKKQKRLFPAAVNGADEQEYLTESIMEFCGDQKSLSFYKKVARLVPRVTIFRALQEAKVSNDLNETKKSKAAHFTFLIKTYAKEQDVKL